MIQGHTSASLINVTHFLKFILHWCDDSQKILETFSESSSKVKWNKFLPTNLTVRISKWMTQLGGLTSGNCISRRKPQEFSTVVASSHLNGGLVAGKIYFNLYSHSITKYQYLQMFFNLSFTQRPEMAGCFLVEIFS